jgi:hypothetical protein
MVDYYPVLARAISGLDPSAPGEMRRALYERARAALIAQLRGAEPALLESEITRERLSLEEAVRKVEAEATQRARAARTPSVMPWRRARESDSADPVPATDPLAELAQLIGRTDPFAAHRDENHASIEDANIGRFGLKQPNLLPPVTVIPEQNRKRAIAFRPSRRGPLDLVPDPPSDFFDPEQSHLYTRIRLQLAKLKDDVPSQERVQLEAVIDDFLDQPAEWHNVEHKKVLWLCGNALRNALAQHDAVKADLEPHYSKLPPAVAEALRRPVETWNVFAIGDPELAELDSIRLGPQEQRAIVEKMNAARPIVQTAAVNREITTEQAGKVLSASLHAASAPLDNINTKQAQHLAEGTSRNLIFQIVRRAYLFCQRLIDPKTDEDRALVLEYKKGVAKEAGTSSVKALIAGATLAAPYAVSFFELVATHAGVFRDYIVIALQNEQLAQVIDFIEYTKAKLKEHSTEKKK